MSFTNLLKTGPGNGSALARRFQKLIGPVDDVQLERLAQEAAAITRRFFGQTMRLFAPLYLSNECINNCRYCGFSRDNPILRVTLSIDQVKAEARHLSAEGFRHILLVAGEHPKFINANYLSDCIAALSTEFSSVSVELGPMTVAEYKPLVAAGAEGLVVYQETYDREIYSDMHTSGPKRDFDYRLDCAERGYEAGFRRLGVGALFGLANWQPEAVSLAAHVEYLLKRCWQSELTVSLPRLRPAAGEFQPRFFLSDRELTQLVCAFRISFPQVGIVLSTREPAALRDALAPLGVTMMSAGSHTEPGGYTGQGAAELHRTVRGKIIAADLAETAGAVASSQFDVSDSRSPRDVAKMLRARGLDTIWKDWDQALAPK